MKILTLATFALTILAGPLGAQGIVVDRFPNGPILTPQSIGKRSAFNYDRESIQAPYISIVGPSLIRVPDWVEQPLGRYYLYFAHHKGGHIRMAYADQLEGPWKVFNPGLGVLRLADMQELVEDHIASPDVHVDQEHERILMYFHGPRRGGNFEQHSWLSSSRDGLDFELHSAELLGKPYFRTFRWGGFDHTPTRLGPIYRSSDGAHNFEPGPELFSSTFRHFAVRVHNNRGFFFYSDKAESPERIRLMTVDLVPDWQQWYPSASSIVLSPTEPYEISHGAKLLDPCLFEEDGQNYLLYSVSNERGIAIAKLQLDDWAGLNVNRIRARSAAPYRLAQDPLGLAQTPFTDSQASLLQAPAEVLGSKLLLTAASDRGSSSFTSFLRFNVSERVRVWVAHDDRFAGRPGWLADWQNTGSSLTLGEGGQSWTMGLFYRDFDAGPISLGGNVAQGEVLAQARAMYCVLIGRP